MKSFSNINNQNNFIDSLNITGNNLQISKNHKSVSPYNMKRRKSKEKFNNLLIFASSNLIQINMWFSVIQFLMNKSN
jgi:hypothetical protein